MMVVPDRCIFCGRASKLTKEHVFAAWIGKAFRANASIDLNISDPHTVTYRASPRHQSVRKFGKLARPGDAVSLKLRVVCQECNSGWMSQLQQSTKPFLEAILYHGVTQVDLLQHRLLARWSLMTAAVIEMADQKTAVITFDQRKSIAEGSLTKSMIVGVAGFSGKKTASFMHRAFAFLDDSAEFGPDSGQITLIRMSEIVIGVLTGLEATFSRGIDLTNHLTDLGFLEIWPRPGFGQASTMVSQDLRAILDSLGGPLREPIVDLRSPRLRSQNR